jgi:UDP:flavonoid glycosyltransferase YjiC (YdhE family)
VRALFFVSGIGRGHAARCRPLIAELQRRGHGCSAATLGRRAAALLRDLCPVEEPSPSARERLPRPAFPPLAYAVVWDLEMSLSWFQPRLAEATTAIAELAFGAIERSRPDLVVVDQLPAAGAVARSLGLPLAQVTHGPLFPGHGPWPRWLGARPPELTYPPAFDALGAGLEAAGAAAVSADELLDGDVLLVPTPPELGTGAGALHFDGRDALPGAQPVRFERRQGRPLVAVSAGPTLRALLPEAVRATALAGADAVVLDAAGETIEGAQTVGPVEMASALAQVDAILHQGGSGTAAACLAAGVGSVVVPTYTEQELNGRGLADAGAGVVVPMSEAPLEPMRVADGITTLVHRRPERLAERVAAAVQAVLAAPHPKARRLPPVGAAADALEALVG